MWLRTTPLIFNSVGRDAIHATAIGDGGAQRLILLVEGAYRFDLSDAAMLAKQFRYFASLSEQVQIKAPVVPDDFSALAEVRIAVLDDLAADPPSSANQLRINAWEAR